jgi:hypothetical protein
MDDENCIWFHQTDGVRHRLIDFGEDLPQAPLPHGAGGHRLEANRCAVSQRAVEDVAQVEEPGERCGAPGERGAVALASAHPSLFMVPPKWKTQENRGHVDA